MMIQLLLLYVLPMIYATSIPHTSIKYQRFSSSKSKPFGVRFVEPQFCDPNVTQYSGYLDMGSDHQYFFWFFESQSEPEKKPLTVWLNGGPGCSSMIGLWHENGPCRSHNGTDITYNPYTWTESSNMLYIDQPSGVGYSYGNILSFLAEEGAVTFYEALQLFYEAFPKYSKLPLHIFGESFAGRYIPIYAEYIVKRNSIGHPSPKLPLQSIGIGNGWINPLVQFNSSSQMACDSSYGKFLSPQECQQMKNNYRYCATLIENCYNTNDNHACVNADRFCTQNVDGLFERSGRNYYDVRANNSVETPPEDHYVNVLNIPEFQKAIGVDRINFKTCADEPYDAMAYSGEGTRDSSRSLEAILNHGIPVLIYAGDADYLCNWYGNYAVASKLKFNGSGHFNNQTLKPWRHDDKEVGQVQSTNLLAFVRVYEAGHQVPYYQPKNSLEMFHQWINRKRFQHF